MMSRLFADAWRMVWPIALAALIAYGYHTLWPLVWLLALLLAWQVWQKWRLARWLQRGDLLDPPHAGGLWEDYYTRLMHLFRYEQRAQQELADILQRARYTADSIDEAIILIEADYRLVYFNRSACQLLHLQASDQGENLTNLVRNPQFHAYLDQGLFDDKLILRDQISQRILQVQVLDLKQQGLLLRVVDITRLERLESLKKDFVANVSHELKTPITVFKGSLELLLDMPNLAPEKKQQLLNTMQLQSERMQHLVNDLLLLAHIENGQAPNKQTLELDALFQRLQQTFDLKAKNKKQTIDWQITPHLTLSGIENELESAFANLLDNAIKYTPDGGKIAFHAYHTDKEICVSVKDNGIGIDAMHLDYITERFYRVNKDRSRDTGGTGLGLAIVKHVLQRHHGKLEISSQPGQGSLFSCMFLR